MRLWRNWQTRYLQAVVLNRVWVQIPSAAPTCIRELQLGKQLQCIKYQKCTVNEVK